MNKNINIAPQDSKLIIYLVVAAKVIVYILLMLGFAGVLGAVCIKAVSFFKIDDVLDVFPFVVCRNDNDAVRCLHIHKRRF